mmetsp:Transcript_70269/g.132598  ORF Transcript_70269/g.132598 Transcript_70269/m.132598 type:complete len:138 (-) Transcript_70269:37-450(-)
MGRLSGGLTGTVSRASVEPFGTALSSPGSGSCQASLRLLLLRLLPRWPANVLADCVIAVPCPRLNGSNACAAGATETSGISLILSKDILAHRTASIIGVRLRAKSSSQGGFTGHPLTRALTQQAQPPAPLAARLRAS